MSHPREILLLLKDFPLLDDDSINPIFGGGFCFWGALELSPSAKVFRWFKLAPSQSHPLSRPESGFVDGEKSQKDGDEDCLKVDDGGVFDEEGILEGSQSLLESLSTRKRKKLLKLQLGRMTTF